MEVTEIIEGVRNKWRCQKLVGVTEITGGDCITGTRQRAQKPVQGMSRTQIRVRSCESSIETFCKIPMITIMNQFHRHACHFLWGVSFFVFDKLLGR